VLLQQLYNGLSVGAIYALIAVGITLVYGLSRIIHFAVGEMVMFGAFAAFEVSRTTGSWTLAFIAALIVMAVFGWLTERGVFQHTLKQPLTGFIVSLGLILVFQNLAILIWTPSTQYVLPPLQGAWDLGAFAVIRQSFVNILIAVSILALTWWVLIRTKYGKALRAVADDQGAAALMGIPVYRVIAFAFIAGAAMAGAAGWLILTAGSISPHIGASYLLRGFAVALIGGLGSVSGAAIAGVGLGIAESLAAGYVSAGWNDAYVFGVMIAILLWKPTGLAKGSDGAHI
jgi:branched-chain amino acid transport system permease protein